MANFLQSNTNETRGYNNVLDSKTQKAAEGISGINKEQSLATYFALKQIRTYLDNNGQKMTMNDCSNFISDKNIKDVTKAIQASPAFQDVVKGYTSDTYDNLFNMLDDKPYAKIDGLFNDYSLSKLEKAKEPQSPKRSWWQRFKANRLRKKEAKKEAKLKKAAQQKAEKEAKAKFAKEEKDKQAKLAKEEKDKQAKIKQEKEAAKKEQEKLDKSNAEMKKSVKEYEKQKAAEAEKANKEKAAAEKPQKQQEPEKASKEKKAAEATKKNEQPKTFNAEESINAKYKSNLSDFRKGDVANNDKLRVAMTVQNEIATNNLLADPSKVNDNSAITANMSFGKLNSEAQKLMKTEKFQMYFESLSEQQLDKLFDDPKYCLADFNDFTNEVYCDRISANIISDARKKVSLSMHSAISEGLDREMAEDGLATIMTAGGLNQMLQKQNVNEMNSTEVRKMFSEKTINAKKEDIKKDHTFDVLKTKLNEAEYQAIADDAVKERFPDVNKSIQDVVKEAKTTSQPKPQKQVEAQQKGGMVM